MSGATWKENSLQTGHCRSPNSITLTLAFGSPSTRPFWGRPLSWLSTSETSATSPPAPAPLESLLLFWLAMMRAATTTTASSPAKAPY